MKVRRSGKEKRVGKRKKNAALQNKWNENSLVGLFDSGALLCYLVHCSLSSLRQSCASHSSAPFDPVHMRARSATLTILPIDPGPGPGPSCRCGCALENVHFHIRSCPIHFYCETILWIDFVFALVAVAPRISHRHILSFRFMCLKHYCRVVKRFRCLHFIKVASDGFWLHA